jgi:hypothetical protein
VRYRQNTHQPPVILYKQATHRFALPNKGHSPAGSRQSCTPLTHAAKHTVKLITDHAHLTHTDDTQPQIKMDGTTPPDSQAEVLHMHPYFLFYMQACQYVTYTVVHTSCMFFKEHPAHAYIMLCSSAATGTCQKVSFAASHTTYVQGRWHEPGHCSQGALTAGGSQQRPARMGCQCCGGVHHTFRGRPFAACSSGMPHEACYSCAKSSRRWHTSNALHWTYQATLQLSVVVC